jgi:hypothetical protein
MDEPHFMLFVQLSSFLGSSLFLSLWVAEHESVELSAYYA